MGAMLKGLDYGRRSRKSEIWTPTRRVGLPICTDPFSPPTGELDQEQLVASWDMMSTGFALAGFMMLKRNLPGLKSKHSSINY